MEYIHHYVDKLVLDQITQNYW